MKRDVSDPKAYLEALDADQLAIVRRVRTAIRAVMPEFDEGLRYGMLDYPGLANLGAQKRYVALYVAPEVLARHRAAFPDVDAGKSCLRFTKLEQAKKAALVALLEDVRDYRASSGGAT